MGRRELRLVPTRGEPPEELWLPPPVRVVLADAHAVMRRTLRLLLDGEEGIDVVADAGDLPSVLRHLDAERPHVLGFGLGVNEHSVRDVFAQLRERAPATEILLLSMQESAALARTALACGALGFVLKQFADSELPPAVRAAARREQYVSPRVRPRLHDWNR